MSSDDQQFLDLLASIPQDMAHYGSRVADYIEKHTNALAADIRDAIDQASWIPESLRPSSRGGGGGGGPALFSRRPPPPPQSVLDKVTDWASKNRTAIAVVVAFTGTSLYLVHRRRKAHARKRRAKKLPNGAKREIVVLACSSFHDALTRSLALDLERRGYVVYVTVSSTEEDSLVQQEAKADLRPLWIDVTSTVPDPAVDVHPNLEPIRELLTKSSSRPSSPDRRHRRGVPGSSLGDMTLAGVVVFPGCSGYPEGPLALLPPSDVVDTVNTRLVSPVLTVQQFLPLLARHSTDPRSPASIVVAYPSIPAALSSPRQIPECLVTASLSALASSLRREVKAAGANVTVAELKLGNFDMGSVTSSPTAAPTHASSRTSQVSSAVAPWHSSQRAALQRQTLGQRSPVRGSAAREFHNAVFDALAPPQTFKAFGRFEWTAHRRADVVYVGSGARMYDVVGRVAPDGLVAFMMGYRRREAGPDVGPTQQERVAPYNFAGSGPASPVRPSHSPEVGAGWGFNSTVSESGIWEKV